MELFLLVQQVAVNILSLLLSVGYPEVFLACGGNFRCRPKADRASAIGRSHERRSREKKKKKAFRAGHYKDLTETGNRARKVSGTQGRCRLDKNAFISISLVIFQRHSPG